MRNSLNRFLISLFVLSSFVSIAAAQRSGPAVERRISQLIARMTLAEKLGQLQQLDGEADGKFRPEHLEMARKGLLGSTLNVRGVRMTSNPRRIGIFRRDSKAAR
jgi:beta-glucosidase